MKFDYVIGNPPYQEEAENTSGGKASPAPKQNKESQGIQLSLYQLDDPLLLEIKDELKKIDINRMSPLDAFDELRSLKKKIGL